MFIRFTLTELSAVGTKELSRALDKQVVRELKCVCVSVKKNTPNATEGINPVRGRWLWTIKKLKDKGEHYIQAMEAFL